MIAADSAILQYWYAPEKEDEKEPPTGFRAEAIANIYVSSL